MKKSVIFAIILAGAGALGAQDLPQFTRVLDTPYPRHTGTAGGDMVVADFNGDNRKDILVTGLQQTAFITWLYLQTPQGGFSLPLKTEHGLPALDRGAVCRAADMDGDGDRDIVMYGRTGVAMQTALFGVYLNDGSGKFTRSADLGKDLLPEDFADVAGAWGKAATGSDNKSDLEVQGLYNASGWSKGILELVDLNQDSRLDIVFAGTKGLEAGTDAAGQMIQRDWETSGVFINQGAGSFLLLNGDGYPKLPVDPEKEPERSYPGLAKVGRGFSASGDFNGDGKLDLVLFGQANTGAKANPGIPETQRNGLPIAEVYLGKVDGTFSIIANPGLPQLIDGAALPLDLNKDGRLDLILAGNTGKPGDPAGGRILRIFLGKGDGTFVPDTAQAYESIPNSPDWMVPVMSGESGAGDLDGDGDIDLVVTGNSNDRALYIYRNTAGKFSMLTLDKLKHGIGTNTISGSGSADATTECDLYVGDIDGDGDADIAINGRGGSFQLLVFSNKQN